jgi:Ca-activated chloride channel homolog
LGSSAGNIMPTRWLLLLFALNGSAQDSLQSPEFKIRTDVELVLLDVSVKDPSGGYVTGLGKDQFQIYENGVLQKISEFAAADVPVAAGLVMDDSGSMAPKGSSMIAAGVAFIEASNPHDQIFVVNFNDKVRLGLPESVPFSDDINLLRAALSSHQPEGRTTLYDAVAFALKHLETSRRDKKTLVVISDGGDTYSTHKFKDVMRLIEESAATVYTVGIFDPDDPDRNPGVLKQIASVSGGESFFPGELAEILPICQKIAKDIRNRYTLGYIPVRTSDKGADRKIRVSASSAENKKLMVRTRTTYRLPERTAPGPVASK